MMIQLPNGKRMNLEENISLEEKLIKTDELLENWEHLFKPPSWENNNVRFFLDGLANYLVWHKEDSEKGKEDKEVLSIRKVEEMEGKRRPKGIPFTYLSESQKELLGMEDGNNEY